MSSELSVTMAAQLYVFHKEICSRGMCRQGQRYSSQHYHAATWNHLHTRYRMHDRTSQTLEELDKHVRRLHGCTCLPLKVNFSNYIQCLLMVQRCLRCARNMGDKQNELNMKPSVNQCLYYLLQNSQT